ncbi:FAD-binding protein [Nocardia harenae]|uniref:FAD-binding protein n=1 Tax=Nocardia harenae TaxID=358707 RepID=UPI0008320C0A|nr:FAD-binding protein [Nocardia harenae]
MEWDGSADVVVIGAGAAGAAAALEAAAAGARVLALDRFAGGGAAALSGGIVYAGGGTSIQRAAGVSDDPAWMLAYLQREVGDVVAPETLRRFVDESPALIDWLIEHGVPFDPSLCPYKTSYPNDDWYLYHSGSELSGAFADIPPAQRGHRVKGRGVSGKKFATGLLASMRKAGIQLETCTRATTLLTDDTGAVIGVECVTMNEAPRRVRDRFARMAALAAKPGIYYPPLRRAMEQRMARLEQRYGVTRKVLARRGVIVSAGGFIADRAMVLEHGPEFRHGLALGTTGDDGSGIRMAQRAGAVTAHMDNISAWRFLLPPSAFAGALLVDAAGTRVIDETRYGAAVGGKLVREHGGLGWLLADDVVARRAFGQIHREGAWFQRAQFEPIRRRAVKATTIEEAARRAGIDPAGLRATVDAHNAAIANGTPDPVGKPAEFREPCHTGPFWLFDVGIKPSLTNPCPMLTLGGVVVNEETGAVRDRDGADIPGLYAAGRTAVGICSRSYVSGLSLADCVFSGRRAGRAVAGAAMVEGTR